MPINFGTAGIKDIKLGNDQISKVYQGNDLVWEKRPPLAPPPGDVWKGTMSLRTAVGRYPMKSIAWSGTQFCAVGHDGKCATSPDGLDWTPQNNLNFLSDEYNLKEIAWSPELSMFCVIAAKKFDPPDSRCFTSSDGVTWSEQVSFRALFGDTRMYTLAWDGSQFCAVGSSGKCATSPNGVTWTNQPDLALATSQTMYSIAWSGTQFCAVGASSGCATSPDGVTWTNQPKLALQTTMRQLNSIVWSPELSAFCTVGSGGACATSPDGVTWKSSPSLSSASDRKSMWAVTQTGNSFCAVGNFATCATSPDGVTWTNQQAFNDALYAEQGQSQPAMYALAWSGTSLCSTGEAGRCATTPSIDKKDYRKWLHKLKL